jgi:hypothetical protein
MTKFFLPFAALLVLASSTVTADMTKFDYEYDGRVLAIETTMYSVELLVEEQKDDWLSKQYNATQTSVGKSIKDGSVTMSEFLQAMNDFYATTETKFTNFARTARKKIASNPVDVSVVNTVVPEYWCDYLFGQMYAIAKESGSAELKTMLENAQKPIEEAITKRIPPNEVNELVVPIYGKGNKIYPSFSKKLEEKLQAFSEKLDEETESVVLKKSTPAPSDSAAAAPGSTTAAPKSGAFKTMAVSTLSVAAVLATTLAMSM